MFVFLGFISMNVVLTGLLVVVVLLLMIQSRRLHGARYEAQIAAASLLEHEQLTALGRMVAGIAHELNTPLSAMSSSVGTQKKAAEMMDAAVAEMSVPGANPAESLAKCEKAMRALRASDEVVELAITRTTQLVRVLRLAGRGEEDETQPVDVNQVINDSILLMSHELRSGVSVTLNLGQVKAVPGWPGALGQVVLNLVQNARQALGESGEITVTSKMQDDKVLIIVADNGPGLPSGCVQKLFQPGFTTKTSEDGTGLGLYICERIVNRHNGEIKAATGAEGGAEFVITLPSSH